MGLPAGSFQDALSNQSTIERAWNEASDCQLWLAQKDLKQLFLEQGERRAVEKSAQKGQAREGWLVQRGCQCETHQRGTTGQRGLHTTLDWTKPHKLSRQASFAIWRADAWEQRLLNAQKDPFAWKKYNVSQEVSAADRPSCKHHAFQKHLKTGFCLHEVTGDAYQWPSHPT